MVEQTDAEFIAELKARGALHSETLRLIVMVDERERERDAADANAKEILDQLRKANSWSDHYQTEARDAESRVRHYREGRDTAIRQRDEAIARAEKAEAKRDAALAENARMKAALNEIGREQSAESAIIAADKFQKIARTALAKEPTP